MRRYKTAAVFVIMLVVAVTVIFGVINRDKATEYKDIDLYFFNRDCSTFAAAKTNITVKDGKNLPEEIVDELIKGPSEKKYNPIMDKAVTVNSIRNSGGNLTVDFSEEYEKTGLLTSYAVIKSLCQLPDITAVKVTVNGKEIENGDGGTLGFITGDEINLESDDDCATGINLYFADADMKKLVKEYRKINITDTQPVEQYIVSELIKGTSGENRQKLLAPNTRIISVETTDGTCYVNFKHDFIDKNISTLDKERLVIYSIVNSLTERSDVKNVQFLIEGKKTDKFGEMNISDLFTRNEALIANE